jgi:hypothetical protein
VTSITVILEALRTVPEANMAEHWRHRHKRAREQRFLVYTWLKHQLLTPAQLPWPMTITLTRIAPRRLDDTAAVGTSLKHCQDGVADFLFACPGKGHYKDNDPRLTWHYAQRYGGVRRYAVEICFSAAAPALVPVSESGARSHQSLPRHASSRRHQADSC